MKTHISQDFKLIHKVLFVTKLLISSNNFFKLEALFIFGY